MRAREIGVARCLAWVVVSTAAVALVPLARAAPGAPTAAVKRTIDDVLSIVSDETLKQPAQHERRRELLEEAVAARFDYEEMARRALAGQWVKLNDAERKEFVSLFKTLLSNTYAKKIEGYSGEQVEYLKERTEGAYAEVRTRIVSDKVQLPLDYRLLDKMGDWRVYDVVIDGVSLVRNYRGQFDEIIRTSSYGELVNKLRKKSEEIKAP
jgi:phospholipid transport system substrate-binding protein